MTVPQVPLIHLDTLWFQISGSRCNLSCAHCFLSCGPQAAGPRPLFRRELSPHLEEAARLGAKHFYLTGGEPFLHSEIEGILADLLALGPTTVLTNGTLIDPNLAGGLRGLREASSHPLELRVSLESYREEENDRLRGAGSFSRTLAGVRALAAEGLVPILTATRWWEAEREEEMQVGFARLTQSLSLPAARLKVLPLVRLGREAERGRPYLPGERVTENCFRDYPREALQCSTCRMVTSEGVYVCPLLVNDPIARLGTTLSEALGPYALTSPACYTCRTAGLRCGNEGEFAEPAASAQSPPRVQSGVREGVKRFYARAAVEPQKELCCPVSYDPIETDHIPPEVLEVSYGCGSPVRLGELSPGEVMLDLGCGGGIDCFIASKQVGPQGRVIGVDMTEEMLARAEKSAEAVGRNLGYRNVELRRGTLEEVPAADREVDLVTSNCVINLSPDKPRVLRELHRVLRHGGRFVISDIVSEGPVPPFIRQDRELWGQCIAGALAEAELLQGLLEAGFYGVEVLHRYLYREVAGARFYSVTVRGRKFVKGPDCVYIGQQAIYLGPFSQVCDDDGHAFPRGVPVEVCTDTAEKLQRPPYAGLFLLTDPTRGVAEGICCAPAPGEKGCC